MKKQFLFIAITVLIVNTVIAGCKQSSNITQTQDTKKAVSFKNSEELDTVDREKEPVYGTQLNYGIYDIEVESSSSMFRIVGAKLIVENEDMFVDMTLSGTGYSHLYVGTGEQAAKSTDENYIYYIENNDGKYTYKLPVEALDKEIDCAAWSIKKERWYDRVLIFQSSSLPKEAFKTTTKNIFIPNDGNYKVEAILNGGTGRANVVSPAMLYVENGNMIASIEWSSPYYDYMLVDGIKYLPVNTEENAVFKIPITELDSDIIVIANTTAMSEPHEIEYKLYFDSNSIELME